MTTKKKRCVALQNEYADCLRQRDEAGLSNAATQFDIAERLADLRKRLNALCAKTEGDAEALNTFLQYEDLKSSYRNLVYNKREENEETDAMRSRLQEFSISTGADLESLEKFYEQVHETLACYIAI
jgi:hypothetical protein